MFGRGGDDRPDVEAERQKDRDAQVHKSNLTGNGFDKNTAEILRQLSEIDDLPITSDDPVMGQLVSKLTSTANLTPEQVTSNEWIREYLLVLYMSQRPTKGGLHGSWRAWAHDDPEEWREPMSARERAELEAFVSSSKLGLTRSEDFAAVEEATRTVTESVLRDESKESDDRGGILGRIRG